MASCVLLGQAEFLAAHGDQLAGVLAHSVASVGEKGLLALLPVRRLKPNLSVQSRRSARCWFRTLVLVCNQ